MLESPPTIAEEFDFDPESYPELGQRLGEVGLRHRLKRQAERTSKCLAQRDRLFPLSISAWKPTMIRRGLRAVGLYGRGYSNFQDIQVRRNVVTIPNLPSAFDGYRLLHISDLHIDLDPALTDVVIERLDGLDYDLCVITGDFRSDTIGPFDQVISETIRLTRQIDSPIYATLGNHDFIEFVPPLEQAGVQFLLNETVVITQEGQGLYLSGIDDSHTYETDDIQRASRSVPVGALSILLSHTPDVYVAAAARQYDLMLCGHTHAGQICLPGGFALQKNMSSPRHMVQGPWQYGEMAGYTSSGAGASGVPIRFFCPPEITIHVLRIDAGQDP